MVTFFCSGFDATKCFFTACNPFSLRSAVQVENQTYAGLLTDWSETCNVGVELSTGENVFASVGRIRCFATPKR